MITGVSWKKWSLLPIFDNDNKQWVVKPSLHKFKVIQKKKKEPSLHTDGYLLGLGLYPSYETPTFSLHLHVACDKIHGEFYRKKKKRIHGEEKN